MVEPAICEVLYDQTGYPVGMAYSRGVPKWKRKRAWKKAMKRFLELLKENSWLESQHG